MTAVQLRDLVAQLQLDLVEAKKHNNRLERSLEERSPKHVPATDTTNGYNGNAGSAEDSDLEGKNPSSHVSICLGNS